jgi:hypothetical protein
MNQKCTKSLSLLDSAESVIEHFFKIAFFLPTFQTLIAKKKNNLVYISRHKREL